MKLKKSNILKYIIIFIFIIGTSLLKPICGNDISIKQTILLCEILLLGMSLFRCRDKKNIFFVPVILLAIGVIVAISRSDCVLTDAIRLSYNYWFVFLCFPIGFLLKNNKWSIQSFLKCVVIITMLSFALRALITLVNLYTGVTIFESIARESAAENWIRNGMLRVNPPAFSLLMIPILLFLFYESNGKWKKRYVICIILTLLYSMLIHQSRSVFLYQIIELGMIVILKNRGTKKQITIYSIISILLIISINSQYGQSFIDSFSLDNKIYGAATQNRLAVFIYFGLQWLASPFLGIGMLSTNSFNLMGEYDNVLATLWDCGFLQSIVQIGFPVLIFYLMLIISGFVEGLKAKKLNSNYYILSFGTALSVLLTGINIDCFMDIFALSVPVCLVLIDYTHFNNRKEGKND